MSDPVTPEDFRGTDEGSHYMAQERVIAPPDDKDLDFPLCDGLIQETRKCDKRKPCPDHNTDKIKGGYLLTPQMQQLLTGGPKYAEVCKERDEARENVRKLEFRLRIQQQLLSNAHHRIEKLEHQVMIAKMHFIEHCEYDSDFGMITELDSI